MKDARYLIRLRPAQAVRPVDSAALLGEIRRRLSPGAARAINLRVSSRAIEFDLFIPSAIPVESLLGSFASLGDLLTCRRLDRPPPKVIALQIINEARQLFNEERFWEVHEVLEDLWKERRGPEKQLVQGLILAAAALVHRQKNEMTVVPTMLAEALRRFTDQPPVYHGWEIAPFRAALEKLVHEPGGEMPRV